MKIKYGRQDVTESDIAAVVDVLKSDLLTQGPVVPLFEKAVCDFTNAKYAIAVNSATSALHIACMALDLGPGDILWTCPNTFVATSNAAIYCGAEVDFIDIDKDSLHYAETHLDIKTIRGNCVSISLLEEAQVGDSDLFIAVTSQETTNITISALSKQLGCKKTIARISTLEFLKNNDTIDLAKLGVDELISPEALAAEEIIQLLDQSAFFNNHKFDDGALTLIGTTLDTGAPFIGKTVKEAARVFQDIHFMPIAIQREGNQLSIIPRGDTVFKDGDNVFFITLEEGVQEIYKLIGKTKTSIKNIMILGGGKIALNTAKKLSKTKI